MKLQLVGKSEKSQGSECVIFGRVEPDTGQFARLPADVLTASRRALAPTGDWKLRDMSPGEGLDHVGALVTASNAPSSFCMTSGPLIVLSHGWSGVVSLLDRGRAYRLDLYSKTSRLLLVDASNEVAVDVTPLASVEDGRLHLPALPMPRLVEHIVQKRAWFALLDPQPTAAPGGLARLRGAMARRKPEPGRLRLMSLLAPALVSGAPAPARHRVEAPAEASEIRRLRDELRLMSAAIDGVMRRLSASA